MAARSAFCHTGSRCYAAACSSARIIPILDTAAFLVVSICILCLRILAGMM